MSSTEESQLYPFTLPFPIPSLSLYKDELQKEIEGEEEKDGKEKRKSKERSGPS
jgi:hypothetical protein